MNLEFAGKLGRTDLIVKEFKYWVIILRNDALTLGNCVFILKSNRKNMGSILTSEMEELGKVFKWFENRTKKLYAASRWDYDIKMTKDNFVHINAIPRYPNSIFKYGIFWVDKGYPEDVNKDIFNIGDDILYKIIEDMQK